LITDVFAQESRSVEIYLSAQKRRELLLDGKEIQTDRDVRLKLNEHVDITFFIEVVTQDRPKQGQFADIVTPTKFCDFVGSNSDAMTIHPLPSSSAKSIEAA
jgi:hypothetical protein